MLQCGRERGEGRGLSNVGAGSARAEILMRGSCIKAVHGKMQSCNIALVLWSVEASVMCIAACGAARANLSSSP